VPRQSSVIRGLQLVRVLVAPAGPRGSGAETSMPRVAEEAAPGGPGQVDGRHPDLAALDVEPRMTR